MLLRCATNFLCFTYISSSITTSIRYSIKVNNPLTI